MKLSVDFEVEHLTHPLDEFQRGGHFVPGMTDSEQRRREWQGDTVHVLELRHLGGQVLRVVADSLPECERLMRLNIPGTLFAYWLAKGQANFSYDEHKRILDRAAAMQEFIDARFGRDTRFADSFDAAMHYLCKVIP